MATSVQDIRHQFPAASVNSLAATLKANAASQGSASNEESTTITANDFLTLLVTEMKNQDPTATTDPNEYVNQLVQVNSLQQLISINETLKDARDPSPEVATRDSAGASDWRQPAESLSINGSGPTSAAGGDIRSAALKVATALAGK